MAMSESANPTPSNTQDPAFDQDIDRYLAEDPETPTNGQDPHSSSEGDWNTPFTQAAAPEPDLFSTDLPDTNDTHHITTPSQQKSMITEVVRIAHRLKLHPYQISRMKSFVTVSLFEL